MLKRTRVYLAVVLAAAILQALLLHFLVSMPVWTSARKDTSVILLAFAGDIMVHQEQIDAAYDPTGETYDFTGSFTPVKPYLQKADLAFCNLEVTLAGEEYGYTGYPAFNAPESLAEALKEAGFDLVSTVNNHSLDRGEEGVYRTLEHLEQASLPSFGTYRSRDERDTPLVITVQGVRLAFLGYTYGTNEIPLPEGKEYIVNMLKEEVIIADLTRAKQAADLIVLYLHWGHEYQRQPTVEQTAMAERFLEAGADLIIGSHPHVLQPVEFVKTMEEGQIRERLVAYSLGNFISDQRLRFTDTGMILFVRIAYDHGTGIPELVEASYIPTWVHKYHDQQGLNFRVLPIPQALEDYRQGKDPLLDTGAYYRLQEAFKETREHLRFLPLANRN